MRAKIDVPFKSMGWDGWYDDVERQLLELADYYQYDYVSTLGDATNLTVDVFREAVLTHFDPDLCHLALAKELVSSIEWAVEERLGQGLDARFESLLPPDGSDDGWRVIASVRANLPALNGKAAPTPRALYDRLMAELSRAGCDSETFSDEYFTMSDIYYAASCGIDAVGFMADVEKEAKAIDGRFESLWRLAGETLH